LKEKRTMNLDPKIFSSPEFLLSASKIEQMPKDEGLEIAFVGRSNSGKSSSINAILGRKSLARTSKTPGRTQLINVIRLTEDLRLIDLPGYGFAKVKETIRVGWERMLTDYFIKRQSLKLILITVDIRRGIKELDQVMISLAEENGIKVYIVFTKIDKVSRNDREKCRYQSLSLYPQHAIFFTSSLKNMGFDEVKKSIIDDLSLMG
jgi:GTP-binding protein